MKRVKVSLTKETKVVGFGKDWISGAEWVDVLCDGDPEPTRLRVGDTLKVTVKWDWHATEEGATYDYLEVIQ